MSSRTRLAAALTTAVAVGVAAPYLEIAWKCRAAASNSEGCVWGRAYFPLSRWVEPLIIVPIVFLVLMLVMRLADPHRPNR